MSMSTDKFCFSGKPVTCGSGAVGVAEFLRRIQCPAPASHFLLKISAPTAQEMEKMPISETQTNSNAEVVGGQEFSSESDKDVWPHHMILARCTE